MEQLALDKEIGKELQDMPVYCGKSDLDKGRLYIDHRKILPQTIAYLLGWHGETR